MANIFVNGSIYGKDGAEFITEITSSDGSISVSTNGPKIDLKVVNGTESLRGFKIYFTNYSSSEFKSKIEDFINYFIEMRYRKRGNINFYRRKRRSF